MSRKTLWIILGVVIVLAVAGAGYALLGGGGESSAATGSGPNYTIKPDDRTLGNPKAKVVMIEYAAPSCPVCAAFNEQSFGLLKQKYIDTGKVFYVFRVFP